MGIGERGKDRVLEKEIVENSWAARGRRFCNQDLFCVEFWRCVLAGSLAVCGSLGSRDDGRL